MGEAIKAVLYGLLNIYNEGEKSSPGCGCLTVAALLVFGLVIGGITQSNLPNEFKLIFFIILLIISLIFSGWMIYQTVKKWKEDRAKGTADNNEIILVILFIAFIIFIFYAAFAG